MEEQNMNSPRLKETKKTNKQISKVSNKIRKNTGFPSCFDTRNKRKICYKQK